MRCKHEYHDEWIQKNKDNFMNYAQLRKEYESTFNVSINHATFVTHCKDHNLIITNVRKGSLPTLTDDDITYLWANKDIQTIKQISDHLGVSEGILHGYMSSNNIRKARIGVMTYTQDHDDWLRDNYCNTKLSKQELTNMFNNKFGTNLIVTAIADRANLLGLKRCASHNSKPWTQEDIDYLIKNYNKMDSSKIAAYLDRTIASIRNEAKKLNLCETKNPYFTDEEQLYLFEIVPYTFYSDMPGLLFEKFGTMHTRDSIACFCQKHIKCPRKTNLHRPSHNIRPIGAERKGANGYTLIKVSSDHKKFHDNWEYKHKYLYEQKFGKIPKDWAVVFLDGNLDNFDINNLYAVPRKALAKLVQPDWFSSDAKFTKVALTWAQLHLSLQEQED